MISLLDYRRDPDGSDWTPAFNRAVAAATAFGQAVRFPSGWLTFNTPPDAITCGVTLEGDSGITSAKLGTCCVANYEETDPERGFFTWNGSDSRTFKGTGGGIRNMSLYRLGGPSGGCAINLICTDPINYRAGWWGLRDVAVQAEHNSTWDRVFLADGTIVGPEGIRQLDFSGRFIASGAKGPTVEFRNAIHVSCSGLQVQGGHTVNPHENPVGLLITGKYSQDVQLTNTAVYGYLDVQQCEQLIFNGLAMWVRIAGNGKVRRSILNIVGCDSMENASMPSDAVHILAV